MWRFCRPRGRRPRDKWEAREAATLFGLYPVEAPVVSRTTSRSFAKGTGAHLAVY